MVKIALQIVSTVSVIMLLLKLFIVFGEFDKCVKTRLRMCMQTQHIHRDTHTRTIFTIVIVNSWNKAVTHEKK